MKAYLIGQGVAGERVSALCKGKSAPVAGNETAEGRRQNRRVEGLISNAVTVSRQGERFARTSIVRTLVQMVDGALAQRRQTIARNGDMSSETFPCSQEEHRRLLKMPENTVDRVYLDDGRRKLCGIQIKPIPQC